MPEITIVHEGDDFYVVNKPSGLAVQGGSGIKRCIVDVLEEQRGSKPFLVHRLDRDTSGLLLLARDSIAARRWTGLFAGGGAIRKRYLACCAGILEKSEGSISSPIVVHGLVRQAMTSWRRLRTFDNYSLLELELGTGRMHQIRIHLQKAAHPVLGDDKYGDFPLNRRLRKEKGLKTLLLHAWKLDLSPPGGQAISLVAPIPPSFSLILDTADL